jgi:ABC-2 type transport system ATP-binding protein
VSGTVLSAHRATRTFRNGSGVFGVDLQLQPGQVLALVGLNGAGKSTLMRMLLGMLHPDSGEVKLAGCPVARAPASAWAAVGHLVEYPLAYPELSVRRNLQLSARMRRVSHVDAAVGRIMIEFALEPYRERRSRALSLGNRQRGGGAAPRPPEPQELASPPTRSIRRG